MLGLLQPKRTLRRKGSGFLRSLRMKGGSKKVWGIVGIVVFLLAVFGYVGVYMPARRIEASAQKVMDSGRRVKASLKENDIDKVEKELKTTQVLYDSFQAEASRVYWMKYIPLAGLYVQDFQNGVEAGKYLLNAAQDSVVAIKPHADLVGLKKGEDTNFVNKSAEERLQTAVLTLDSIVNDVDKIAKDVDEARKRIAQINPKRYPTSIGDRQIRQQVADAQAQFEGIAALFVDAKPFIKSLPDMLGAKEKKTYLFLFQNDTELRATGGFLTAYAVFEVDQGKFTVKTSDDIYTLDNAVKSHPAAPDPIRMYHKNVSKYYIRDSNLSPDFPTSVALFEKLYRTSSVATTYDGIIAVDTEVLIHALDVLGDTQARGLNFSSRMDPRCDCPQVIYTLLDEIDRPVAYIKTDRKGILGDLLLNLMQKALGVSPSQYWGKLSQVMMKDLQEKHIQMYMIDPKIQKALAAMNFAGEIRETKGDYLHINDVNLAGAKSNLYVQHEVLSKTNIQSDGTVQRSLQITYRNPRKHSNCSLEEGGGLGRGGLCINAVLRNWVRVYVPQGSTLGEFKGSEKKVRTYDELGKTVFEGFLQVSPQGKSVVNVTYTLPNKVENENEYTLMIQKQGGTSGHAYSVEVQDGQIWNQPLVSDIVLDMSKL